MLPDKRRSALNLLGIMAQNPEVASSSFQSSDSSSDSNSDYDIYGKADQPQLKRDKSNDSEALMLQKMHSLKFAVDPEEAQFVHPWWLMSKQGKFKMFWDFLIMTTVLYVTTVAPIRIAFIDFENQSVSWLISDVLSDVLLLIDILLNFFVIQEDALGIPIISLRGIAKHYVQTYFFLDLFSALPVSSIVLGIMFGQKQMNPDNIAVANLIKSTRLYKLFVLLKILRVIRMSKILERIVNTLNFTPAVSSLAVNLLKTTFLLHFIGCIWGIIAVATNLSLRGNWIRAKGLESTDSLTRYLTSCYWAVVTINTVGYGEISPTNVYEVFSNILIMWTGVTTQSYIMSRVTEIFLEKQNDDASRTEKIQQFFQKSQADVEEQQKVQHFFQPSTNIIHQLKQLELSDFISILPLYLKAELCYYMYKQAITDIKILQNKNQPFYANKLLKLIPMRIKAGTVLGFEGCHLEEIFLLLDGCVLRESKVEQEMGLPARYLVEGFIFGEKNVLFNKELSGTYTAQCDCDILKITKEDFLALMSQNESFRQQILHITSDRETLRVIDINKVKSGEPLEEGIGMSEQEYSEFSQRIYDTEKDLKEEVR